MLLLHAAAAGAVFQPWRTAAPATTCRTAANQHATANQQQQTTQPKLQQQLK
jgi:hypothetical protein